MVDLLLGLAFIALLFAPAIVAFLHWRKSNGGEL